MVKTVLVAGALLHNPPREFTALPQMPFLHYGESVGKGQMLGGEMEKKGRENGKEGGRGGA